VSEAGGELREHGAGPGRFDVLRSTIEREEHATNIIRLRKALWIGVALWPGFFGTDYLMAEYVHDGSFVDYAWIRASVWLFMVALGLILTYARRISPDALVLLDVLSYGGGVVALSLMCLLHAGLASPYAAGIPVIATIRAGFVAVPWRRGIWPLGAGVIAYPAVVLGAALLRGELSSVFDDAAELSVFVLYNALILTTFVATLTGGHQVWALRRQVFEARNIGRYRLQRPLARGGMGEVWVAHDAKLRRLVALKVLRSDAPSDVAVKRFEREVEATSELTHPHTIRVFDYGVTDDGLCYYAMELLEGEDLAGAVARTGPFAPERCAQLMLQVCGALAEAHARGIVHRDVKPQNVFLSRVADNEDFVKVLDFGIAKRAQGAAGTQLTKVDRMLGTPEYISPEVALGRTADARSDVYGLGGLLYFLLTGCAPFDGNDAAQLIAHAVQLPALPSQRLGSALDPALEAIVMRCLSKEPADRFAHAGELLAALQTWQLQAGQARASSSSERA
jgi:serine/threonine-protein kinase